MPRLKLTQEEWQKLLFKGWELTLAAIITAIVALVPTLRSLCLQAFRAVGTFAASEKIVWGWLLIVLAAFAVVGFVAVAQWAASRIGPNYVRCFREGEYDNVIWRWKWKRGAVDLTSMRPFCSKCGTGVVASHNQGGMITVGIVTRTRIDTHLFCPTCNTTAGFSNVDNLWELVRLKIEGDASRKTWNEPQERVLVQLRHR
jgi:hypothetical protein